MTPRPASAVSPAVGWVGLATLIAWLAVARTYRLGTPLSALACVAVTGLAMILWSVGVDRVHRRATTGIDWDAPPARDRREISIAKLAGLWTTWALIGVLYWLARPYAGGSYPFATSVLAWAAGPILIVSVPYVFWLDRRLRHPRDGAWALGAWLMGQRDVSTDAIADHARGWAVKAFFLAFILSIVPAGYAGVVTKPWAAITASPAASALFLIETLFLIDVVIATVGYTLTLKPLDAHIRSAMPHLGGWVAALACYPPFSAAATAQVLGYEAGTKSWDWWLAAAPVATTLWGAVLVALTALYAWATVAFGLRFSNLTHRGILTHGPYALTKHPAYLAKNLFWWGAAMPFLVTTHWTDAVRNCAALLGVNALYWWRAQTEERHLSTDPDYRAYAAWIAARHRRWFRS